MKKVVFGFILVLFSFAVWNNINANQKSMSFWNFALSDVEALAESELGCINQSGKNDGDCTTDGSTYFCENSIIFHDCVRGLYP